MKEDCNWGRGCFTAEFMLKYYKRRDTSRTKNTHYLTCTRSTVKLMPQYPLTYERFRDILHKDNSQIFTAESSETIIGFIVVNGNSVVILCVKKSTDTAVTENICL